MHGHCGKVTVQPLLSAQGLEVFSTVLWHLKREVALAHLAQEALAQETQSRQGGAGVAILGNCFSLQKARAPTPALACRAQIICACRHGQCNGHLDMLLTR